MCRVCEFGVEPARRYLDFQGGAEGHLERPLNIFGENSLEGLFEK